MKYWGLIKKITITLLLLCICTYLTIYLAIPYFLNKKDYSLFLTDTIKEKTGLILLIDNYKITTTPRLELNLKASKLQLFYPDKKLILQMQKPETSISVLNLIKKEIKINKISAEELQFSTKLLKTGKTTIQTYINNHVKQNNTHFSFAKKPPKIKVKKYIIKIKDEKTGQKFKFEGNNFETKQNPDLRYINIFTEGSAYCFDKKYLSYKTKTAIAKSLFKNLTNIDFQITFDNIYQQTFSANLFSDLKINAKNDMFDYVSGKIDIQDFKLKLSDQELPPSYFLITLDKGKASVVSKFYTNTNEVVDISSIIKTTKPYDIDIKCLCPKAEIQNLQKIANSIFDLLKIKNDFKYYNLKGEVNANFKIKTDLKTIKSTGTIKIKDGIIKHKDLPFNITNANANIDLADNSVNIKNSTLLFNQQPAQITASIDKNATGFIEVKANNLDINKVTKAFSNLNINKDLIIKKGYLSLEILLKGKLLEAKPKIHAIINDLNLYEKKNKIEANAKNVSADLIADIKTNNITYQGNSKISDLLIKSPKTGTTINSKEIVLTFDNKDLKLKPSKFSTQDANLIVEGSIKNYAQQPNMQTKLTGTIDTAIIKELSLQNIKLYNKGYLPINATIKSDLKNSLFDIYLLSNPQNYITPVVINNYKNKNTLTHALLKTNDNTVVIEEFAQYYADTINHLKNDVNLNKLSKVLSIKGKIKDYNTKKASFNNIKVQTIDTLNISYPEYQNTNAVFNADLTINGTQTNPEITGFAQISNLQIPQYQTQVNNILLQLTKNNISAKLENIKLNNSNISAEINTNQNFIKTQKIDLLKINAQELDFDNLLAISNLLMQTENSTGLSIPYTISSGKINIKKLKINNIFTQNLIADISLKNNNIYITNLFCDTYGGKIAGNITHNIPYSSTHAKLQGRGLNAFAASSTLLPENQQLSGTLNFDSEINLYGTNPQKILQTTKGSADIHIQNGHLGQLGRFEHFLYAQNLLSHKFIDINLNTAKQAISPKDTGRFTNLKGKLNINNGIIRLNPIITAGPQMSMYITGQLNPITNYADLQILGKVSSEVSSSLGSFGKMTIKNFLEEHTSYNQDTSKQTNTYNTDLPEMDVSKIPELNPNLGYQTKNFRVLIIGEPESVKSVKSFTWVNPIKTIPNKPTQTGNTTNTLTSPIQPVPNNTTDFLDTIPDSFN